MLKKEAKTILSTQNGMNPYRGCEDGGFRDARFTDSRRKNDPGEPEAKINAAELLEMTLRRKRSKCMIAAGGMCDPYPPEEEELRLMRNCLEVIDRYGYGVTIQTRSPLLLRDLDLLKSINRKSRCIVLVTLAAAEESLREKLEPGACSTAERIRLLNSLKEAGIPTVVRLTPLLPMINDTAENLRALMEACVGAGIYGIQTYGLSFMYRVSERERFYSALEERFPGMKEKYLETFGQGNELVSPAKEELTELIHRTCGNYHIEDDAGRIFTWLHAFVDREAGEQMSLFDLQGTDWGQ